MVVNLTSQKSNKFSWLMIEHKAYQRHYKRRLPRILEVFDWETLLSIVLQCNTEWHLGEENTLRLEQGEKVFLLAWNAPRHQKLVSKLCNLCNSKVCTNEELFSIRYHQSGLSNASGGS